MSETFITRSHLGHILNAGDYALGYDIRSTNFNSDLFEDFQRATMSSNSYSQIPDVILVRKLLLGRRKRGGKGKRNWKLKRFTDDAARGLKVELTSDDITAGAGSGKKTGQRERNEHEWEGFMQELEQDQELRGMLNLYKGLRRNF